MTVTHSSIEPSWLPQVPASLKISGFSECEFLATSATDRSVRANSSSSAPNASAHSSAWTAAAGRTSAASAVPPSRRPSSPATSCSPASAAASHRAARPNSAIIASPRPLRASALRSCPPARAACSSRRAWRAGSRPRTCRRPAASPFGDDARAFDGTGRARCPANVTGTRALPSPTTKSIVTPSGRVLSEPCLDHPAEPHRLARLGRTGRQVARHVEQARLVAQRPGREQRRADQRDERDQHEHQPLVLGLERGAHLRRPSSRRFSAARIASQLQPTSSRVPITVTA